MSNSSFTSKKFLQRSLVTTKQHPQIVKLLARLTGCDNSSVWKRFHLTNYFITFFKQLFKRKKQIWNLKSLHAYTPHKAIKRPQGKNQLQNIAPRGLALCPLIPLNHCSPLTNHQQLPLHRISFQNIEFLYTIMHSTSTC